MLDLYLGVEVRINSASHYSPHIENAAKQFGTFGISLSEKSLELEVSDIYCNMTIVLSHD